MSSAGEELAAIGARLAQVHPDANEGYGIVVQTLRRDFVPEVAKMYRGGMRMSARFAAEFRGFWGLPDDFEI